MIGQIAISIIISLFFFQAHALKIDKKFAKTRYRLMYASPQGLVNFITLCQKDCSKGVRRLGVGDLINIVENEKILQAAPKSNKVEGTQ